MKKITQKAKKELAVVDIDKCTPEILEMYAKGFSIKGITLKVQEVFGVSTTASRYAVEIVIINHLNKNKTTEKIGEC